MRPDSRSNKIFLAFSGKNHEDLEQFSVFDDIEIWNLKKLTFKEFVEKIKVQIPPVNDNVLCNYHKEICTHDRGTTKEWYKNASWGILLSSLGYPPDKYSILSIVNLFATRFIMPLFDVTDFGIREMRQKPRIPDALIHVQDQVAHFASTNFSKFLNLMGMAVASCSASYPDRQNWSDENWRRSVALSLYMGLQEYDEGRDIVGWQREAAEISIILEMLLTAADASNAEVGYRLKKRAAAFMQWKIPTIQTDIGKLYGLRSSFVHGSFFSGMADKAKKGFSGLPIDLDKMQSLEKYKELTRIMVVAYLWLDYQKMSGGFISSAKSTMDLIEDSVIDTDLRKKIISVVTEVVKLVPYSVTEI